MPDTSESINDIGIPEINVDVTEQETPELQTTVTAARDTVLRPTDTSLSVANMPADAKATGDAIAGVEATLADVAADVSNNTDDIERIDSALTGYVPKTDIDTTLAVADKVAESKATGDAIAAAITTARNGIITSIDGITANSNGEATLDTLLPTASEIQTMIGTIVV